MAKVTRKQPPEEISIEVKRVSYRFDEEDRGIFLKSEFKRGNKIGVKLGRTRRLSCMYFDCEEIPVLQEMLQEFMEALESIDD